MTAPVLLVVDHDPRELATFERTLKRRYGADYKVMVERSPEAALELLERLARRGEDAALVAADLRLPGTDGVEFLEQASALHLSVVRALLVAMDEYHARIPFKEMETIRHATALGRIDFWVVKGWTTPEEWLYPRVQEALSAWTRTNRSRHVVYRMVGERWAPRTHALRDTLTRNSVPFEFHRVDSGEGATLVDDFGVDTERLPALIRHDGSVLHDPTPAEVANSHGIRTQPSPGLHDLAVLGAGPAGLAAAVYGASEGLKTLVLEPLAIGGRLGRAR
jgi:thioredoxin reductase (NADPH)